MMRGMPFYQYRFILQTNNHLITCHRITSHNDSVIIERNHMVGQRTLEELIPSSSPPESYVWMFTKKNDMRQSNSDIHGRRISISWHDKEWSPLGLFYGSNEYAMELVRLTNSKYAGVVDVAFSNLPSAIGQFLVSKTESPNA